MNLNETEKHHAELATHIDLTEIDYPTIMRQQTQRTYIYLGIAGACFIIASVFFIAELLPKIKGIGSGYVSFLYIMGLYCLFKAMHYQKEMETRVTYEVLQKIHAIEGKNGFLWRLNTLINSFCLDKYGALPDGVQQLQTSSQTGGIEMSEIRLYKDIMERVVQWYKDQPQSE